MTDAELDALEAAAKAATPGPWETDYHLRKNTAYIAAAVLDIIVELRQARRERDWLAEVLARDGVETKKDWLRAARQLTMEEE